MRNIQLENEGGIQTQAVYAGRTFRNQKESWNETIKTHVDLCA